MGMTRLPRWRPAPFLGLLVLGLYPAIADAQLFPDLPIKRQRPCCLNEDPRFGMIRREYFGYYPTCWRRFPDGWGCPSPEAPDWAASLHKTPLDLTGEYDPFTADTSGGDLNGSGPVADEPLELPEVPPEGSLFNTPIAPPGGGAATPPPSTGPGANAPPLELPPVGAAFRRTNPSTADHLVALTGESAVDRMGRLPIVPRIDAPRQPSRTRRFPRLFQKARSR